MKQIILISFFCLACGMLGFSQGAQTYFNTSANLYVNNKRADALRTIQEGIQKYPNDPKLRALGEKLKEEEKQKEDQKRNQEQKDKEQKEQQQKDQQKKDQEEKEKKEQQQKEDQQSKEEKEDKEKKDKKDGKEQQQRENKENESEKKETSPQLSQKLQEMKMSEEKAKMILEAMKNQEIQYLQQNKRKATKQKDRSKPDW